MYRINLLEGYKKYWTKYYMPTRGFFGDNSKIDNNIILCVNSALDFFRSSKEKENYTILSYFLMFHYGA